MNKAGDVEDQADAAIAQNGGSSKERIALETVTESLDDNFLLAEEFVNQHATFGAVGFDDDHDGLRGIGLIGLDSQKFVEAQKRDQASANIDDFAFAVNGGKHIG